MLQQGVVTTGGSMAKVYKCVLTPNREDRARYAELVSFEDIGGRLVPIRRAYQWVRGESTERFVCVRVTELRWRDLVPAQAHVEMRDAWLAHVKEQKAKARASKAPDHLVHVQMGGVR